LRFQLVTLDLSGFKVDLRVVPLDHLLVGWICSQVLSLTSSTWSRLPPLRHLCRASPTPSTSSRTPTHDSSGSKPEEPASTGDSIPSTFYRWRREASTSVDRLVQASSATRSAPLQPTQAAVFPLCCSHRRRHLSSPPVCSSPAQSR
jgi:hypothetical protein